MCLLFYRRGPWESCPTPWLCSYLLTIRVSDPHRAAGCEEVRGRLSDARSANLVPSLPTPGGGRRNVEGLPHAGREKSRGWRRLRAGPRSGKLQAPGHSQGPSGAHPGHAERDGAGPLRDTEDVRGFQGEQSPWWQGWWGWGALQPSMRSTGAWGLWPVMSSPLEARTPSGSALIHCAGGFGPEQDGNGTEGSLLTHCNSCFHKKFFSGHRLETLGSILHSRWELSQIKDYEAVLVSGKIYP